MASTSTFHNGDGTTPCVDELMLPVDNGDDDTTSWDYDDDTTSCEDESMTLEEDEGEDDDEPMMPVDVDEDEPDDAGALRLLDRPIRNILSRVPPSSATRFKVVCKRWHSMLTDDSYARDHHRAAPVRSVLLCDGDAPCPVTVVDEAGAVRLALHPWRRRRPRHGFTVHNCCGAMACLRSGQRDAELLNPATGEALALGHFFRHGERSTWTLSERFPWYCLGRCAGGTGGEYKVVRLDVRLHPVSGRSAVACAVLSLGQESWDSSGRFTPEWKKVRCVNVKYCPADRGVHVAGVVYYLAGCLAAAGTILASLDLGTHKFCKVNLPEAAATEALGGAVASLSEMDGRLCLSLLRGATVDMYLGDGVDGGGGIAWFQVCRLDDVAEGRVPRPLLRRGGRTLMKRAADGSLCYYICDMDGGGRGKGTAAGEEVVVYEHHGGRRELSGVTADVFVESPLPLQAILRGG